MPELIYQSEFKGEEMDARFAAVAQLTAALEALTAVVAQKYVKPASGIPSTDMDADVQAALAKANTAVQSLADYYTKSEVDALIATINGQQYVDVSSLPTASASTMGKIYLVGPDASGYYAYYYTSYDGSAYSWVGPLGTTQISLANYATKEELSQLDQKMTMAVYDSPYILKRSVDITANWTDAVTATVDKGYRYDIKVTVPSISSYVVVVLAESDNTEIARVTASSAGTVALFYTPTETKQIKVRFYSTARPTGVQVVIIKDTEINTISAINREKAATPEARAAAYRVIVAGALDAYTDYSVCVFKVNPGGKVLIDQPQNMPSGWVKYAFFSSVLPSAGTLVGAAVTASGNSDYIYGLIDVPNTATHIAINVSGYTYLPYVVNYVAEKEYPSIFEDYFFMTPGRYIKSGAITQSNLTDLRLYYVRPGEKYRIQSERLTLSLGQIVGFYSKNEIKADNYIADDLATFVAATGSVAVDHIYTVPAGAFVMAVSCLKATPPIVERVSDKAENTIFDYNPANEVWQKLLQMKFRAGRDTSIESNGMPNLCLCYFSDIHGDAENTARITDFVRRYDGTYRLNNYRKFIDGVLCGGDMMPSEFSQDYSFWADNGMSACLPTIGNHDAWAYPGPTVVGEQDCYEKFIEPYLSALNITQPEGAGENGYYPCYYYKDYAAANIRLVVIDCMHWGDDEDTPGTQATWLADVLDDAKTNEIAVVVVSHYPPTITFDKTTTFCDIHPELGAVIPNTIPAIVQDFINAGGEFVCWLSGHTHIDEFGKVTAYPDQACLVISSASIKRDMDATDDRVEFTAAQDCFNMMAFDSVNKYIKVFRVGVSRDSALRHKGAMCYNYDTQTLIYND